MWIEKAWQALQKCFREDNFEKVKVETLTFPLPLTEVPAGRGEEVLKHLLPFTEENHVNKD